MRFFIAALSRTQSPEFSLASVAVNRNLAAEVMIDLEVYAAGVRDLRKIAELDHELEVIPGLRDKVRSIFRRLPLERRFIGAIPPELRDKRKPQLLSL